MSQIAIGKNTVRNARQKMLGIGMERQLAFTAGKPLPSLTIEVRNSVVPIVGMQQTENCHYGNAKFAVLNSSQGAAGKNVVRDSVLQNPPILTENGSLEPVQFVENSMIVDIIHARVRFNVRGSLENKKCSSRQFTVCDVANLLTTELDLENTAQKNVETFQLALGA